MVTCLFPMKTSRWDYEAFEFIKLVKHTKFMHSLLSSYNGNKSPSGLTATTGLPSVLSNRSVEGGRRI